MIMQEHPVLAGTRRWIDALIIGQQLCPFAAAPVQQGGVVFHLSHATQPQQLVEDLYLALCHLRDSDPAGVETSFLVHPGVLQTFEAQQDFMVAVDGLVYEAGLEGEIQVVAFHPGYLFAGEEPSGASHYTNRSPYPMLHLLREDSVSRAVAFFAGVEQIPRRNIARLRKMGVPALETLLATCRSGDVSL
ncbi:MAG: DUF1415 domain-containing protein [Bacteroidia bacterium]